MAGHVADEAVHAVAGAGEVAEVVAADRLRRHAASRDANLAEGQRLVRQERLLDLPRDVEVGACDRKLDLCGPSLLLGITQRAVASLQRRGHAVEGAGEQIELVALAGQRDARVEIAAPEQARGRDEPIDLPQHEAAPEPCGGDREQGHDAKRQQVAPELPIDLCEGRRLRHPDGRPTLTPAIVSA